MKSGNFIKRRKELKVNQIGLSEFIYNFLTILKHLFILM